MAQRMDVSLYLLHYLFEALFISAIVHCDVSFLFAEDAVEVELEIFNFVFTDAAAEFIQVLELLLPSLL